MGDRVGPRPLGKLQPFGNRIRVAGVAEGTDDLTSTRLGGLNPYVVPLAGAFWGEFWVEDYAAARVGPRWQTERARLALLADLATFDGQQQAGVAVDTRLTFGDRAFVAAALGVAPGLERACSGRTTWATPHCSPSTAWRRRDHTTP